MNTLEKLRKLREEFKDLNRNPICNFLSQLDYLMKKILQNGNAQLLAQKIHLMNADYFMLV